MTTNLIKIFEHFNLVLNCFMVHVYGHLPKTGEKEIYKKNS